jgi:hypothetical protein
MFAGRLATLFAVGRNLPRPLLAAIVLPGKKSAIDASTLVDSFPYISWKYSPTKEVSNES